MSGHKKQLVYYSLIPISAAALGFFVYKYLTKLANSRRCLTDKNVINILIDTRNDTKDKITQIITKYRKLRRQNNEQLVVYKKIVKNMNKAIQLHLFKSLTERLKRMGIKYEDFENKLNDLNEMIYLQFNELKQAQCQDSDKVSLKNILTAFKINKYV